MKHKVNFIIILDYSAGQIIKIKLTGEQKKEAEKFEDFEEYVKTLEEQYNFRLKDCMWMSTGHLTERNYGL